MKRILIVDDEPDIVDLIKNRLESSGYEILLASNGEEAIKMTYQEMPDLIIMDQLMPKMDGIKACALIKVDMRYLHIPIIMLTASANESDRRLSQEVGVNAFCNKPLNIKVLMQKIDELIASSDLLRNAREYRASQVRLKTSNETSAPLTDYGREIPLGGSRNLPGFYETKGV
ncbi:MAG: response regulator [Candidatus Omnitrophica bacterium]|nr:response regulator [Candidatus Omnitrophota bacterium]